MLRKESKPSFGQTVTIAPMTTKSHHYPTRVKINHNNQRGWIVIDQIMTIDESWIIKSLGSLSAKEITSCKRILKETFVDYSKKTLDNRQLIVSLTVVLTWKKSNTKRPASS